MIRGVLLLAAFALITHGAITSVSEARYLARASRSIPDLLHQEDARAGGVFIVLQAADCLRSGELVAHWNALQSAGRFAVKGLVVGNERLSKQQKDELTQKGVTFPLRGIAENDAALVAQKLGYNSTPFAIVLNREGRVTASFPGKQNVPADALMPLIEQQ